MLRDNDPIPMADLMAIRHGTTKAEALFDLMRRPDGVSQLELEAASGWKAGSVRGWIKNQRAQKKPAGYLIRTTKARDSNGKPLKGARVVYRLEVVS